ncbi:hypothetical protein [Streptomyces sp. NPDC047972]|uniref:hypothetical protein n=1 Tax=Streptomyces sp. NPDC047972 TaxID=3365493 RepID=UPI0037159743
MSTYLVTVPVDFKSAPNPDLLSTLNDSLREHDPHQSTFSGQDGATEFVARGSSAEIRLFNLVVEADSQEDAERKGRILMNSALLDAGRTVVTAETILASIEAQPLNADQS